MKERPILFKGELIPAVLENLATQTRRVVNPQPYEEANHAHFREGMVHFYEDTPSGRIGLGDCSVKSPYGQVGDFLWVRETWAGVDWLAYDYEKEPAETIGYRADKSALHMGIPLDTAHWNWDLVKWKSPIFMPKWASRIKLEITSIRVERVQEINPEDAIASGIEQMNARPLKDDHWKWYGKWFEENGQVTRDPCWSFKTLWDVINAKRGFSWKSDPWVWVIGFKLAI